MTLEEAEKFIAEAGDRGVILKDRFGSTFSSHKGYPKVSHGRVALSDFYSLDPSDIYMEYGYNAGKQDIRFGSDPEFFYLKDGKVAPGVFVAEGMNSVAPDGFQSELHPDTDTCRQISGNHIGQAIDEAWSRACGTKTSLDFSVGRDIDDKTFLSVPAKQREFGCSPTRTAYGSKKPPNGSRTRFRSCGGHIHLGNGTLANLKKEEQVKLVKLLDIICGNTCVMIDRDKNNIRRRKIYGRAGEYRMKPYGIEYRVPSNFWLNGYVLWSMVSGLARNATNIYMHAPKFADIILDTIDINKVRKAINNNDIDLAREVFDEYTKLLVEHNVILMGGVTVDNYEDARRFLLSENGLRDASCCLGDWIEGNFEDREGFEEFISFY